MSKRMEWKKDILKNEKLKWKFFQSPEKLASKCDSRTDGLGEDMLLPGKLFGRHTS